MRYVGYVRISSEDQRGNYSLNAQKHAIRLWVAQQKGELQGTLVRFYEDEAYSAQTDDRPAFQEMVRDGRRKQFDAVVVHKFDLRSRSRRDASIYKSLFRSDLRIKVFAVSPFVPLYIAYNTNAFRCVLTDSAQSLLQAGTVDNHYTKRCLADQFYASCSHLPSRARAPQYYDLLRDCCTSDVKKLYFPNPKRWLNLFPAMFLCALRSSRSLSRSCFRSGSTHLHRGAASNETGSAF